MILIWDTTYGCQMHQKFRNRDQCSMLQHWHTSVIAFTSYMLAGTFCFPALSIEEYNDRVTAVVRCEAQDTLLQKLLKDDYLSEQERDVLRWGKNVGTSKTRTRRRVGTAVYNRASSLEMLIGYLYLTNVNRLEKVMVKLGFSAGVSTQMILAQTNGGKEVVLLCTGDGRVQGQWRLLHASLNVIRSC
ncbi:hypothetical protein Q3G72_014795 [Acer saccharum]|nr:hypothetical protein Q3G72_014795 [Acer saccharum]